MLGLLLGQWVAVDSIVWIDKLIGRKSSTTLLALVAVGTRSMTTRTLATDITVGEELLGLRVVELFGCLLYEFALIIQLAEEIRSQLMVRLARGAGIDIKRNTKTLERVLDNLVVAIYHLLSSNALLACADGNRYAMLIATTYK